MYLFPDVNATEKSQLKAHELAYITNFTVSEVLETIATGQDRKQGLDLADYLLREYKAKIKRTN